MKNGNDVAARVADALQKLGVEYLLAGSFSSNFYGIPRATNDADFVAVLGGRVAELERELGPDFVFDPQPSFEMVTGTFRERVSVPALPFDIEIFRLSGDAHDQARFARRRRVHVASIGREVCIPTAEDVIITKLRWAVIARREKDREDVRNIMAVQGDAALDWQYIRGWCEQHDTWAALEELRASIPPA